MLKRLRRLLVLLIRYTRFVEEFLRFRKLSKARGRSHEARWSDRYPCLDDRTGVSGFDAHYIYHTAWATRALSRLRPAEHVDISSSLYFVAIASAYVPIRFYDYRPAALRLSNLSSETADVLQLPFPDGSVNSLSCMHVIEHVGLGRYGDPLDPRGDEQAARELQRVLAHGGTLLMVVPVGVPRVCFNAHRVYSCAQVKGMFSSLRLVSFALVTDMGEFQVDASEAAADSQRYGCGCFEFTKQ
jgi:SAM-dependent methyltransferase